MSFGVDSNVYCGVVLRLAAVSPFAPRPCHSERSEESPPFAKRKGAGGMPWQSVNCDGNDWNDGL